jgi:hypothetical protein
MRLLKTVIPFFLGASALEFPRLSARDDGANAAVDPAAQTEADLQCTVTVEGVPEPAGGAGDMKTSKENGKNRNVVYFTNW